MLLVFQRWGAFQEVCGLQRWCSKYGILYRRYQAEYQCQGFEVALYIHYIAQSLVDHDRCWEEICKHLNLSGLTLGFLQRYSLRFFPVCCRGKESTKKVKLINLEALLLFLGKLSFAPFHKCLSATFLFNLLSKLIPIASAGLNSNNCVADLDIAIKKVSPIEQRLIYQLCYHCCLQLITCYPISHFRSESARNLLLENNFP